MELTGGRTTGPTNQLLKCIKVHEDFLPNFVVIEPPLVESHMGGKFDAYQVACQLARYPWRKKYGASTIILDTADGMGHDFTRYSAINNLGSEGWRPEVGAGPDLYKSHNRSDIGKAQEWGESVLRLFLNQPLHVFLLSHKKAVMYTSRQDDDGNDIKSLDFFGFQMPGQALTAHINNLFGQSISLRNIAGPGQPMKIQANFAEYKDEIGRYKAKVRSLAPEARPTLNIPKTLEGMQAAWIKAALWNRVKWDAPIALEAGTASALDVPWRAGLWSESGLGKTTWATALPQECFDVGPAIYIAYDMSAVNLPTTWDALRSPPSSQ